MQKLRLIITDNEQCGSLTLLKVKYISQAKKKKKKKRIENKKVNSNMGRN